MEFDRGDVISVPHGATLVAPHTQVRPTALFVVAFFAGVVLDRFTDVAGPAALAGDVAAVAGAVTLGLGAAITLACLRRFSRAGTGIMPDQPARRVIADGAYAWSRNPMFVGFTLIYAGLALLVDSTCALALLPLALALTTQFVIRHEEAYMRRTFGGEYDRYAATVNRWIGRRHPPA